RPAEAAGSHASTRTCPTRHRAGVPRGLAHLRLAALAAVPQGRGAGRRKSAWAGASASRPAAGLVLGERGRVRRVDAGQRRAGLDLLEEERFQALLVEASG